MDRYGKPSSDILGLKDSFFRDNDELLERTLAVVRSYTSQPLRERCKNCAERLGAPTFHKHGVGYVVCERCTHLNGAHEDTDEFLAALYTSDGGSAYAATYDAQGEPAFRARVAAIYRPKAQFLVDALAEQGVDADRMRYADFGAGSGYFVAALGDEGIEDVGGYEVSEVQVALANRMIPGSRVRLHGAEETLPLAERIEADVVSMIGVLEHLQDPREMVRRLRANPHVRFIYASVPVFSLSVFIELAFPGVFPRHLSSSHTHLYTDASLAWLEREFGLERLSQWWFGTDVVDLYRGLRVTLARERDTAQAADLLGDMLVPAIDGMQLGLDSEHLASEVHVVWRAS